MSGSISAMAARHDGEDDCCVLADLGIMAQAAEQVEHDVLAQALADAGAAQDDEGAAAKLPGEEGAADEEQQQQRELARRLRNVQQEVLAVQGALTGVQQGLGPMAGPGPDAHASAAAAGAEPGGAGRGKRRAFGTGISRGKAARTAVASDAATSSLASAPLSAGQAAALPGPSTLAGGGGGGGGTGDGDDAGTAAEGHAAGVQLQQAVLQARLQALQDERSRLQALLSAGETSVQRQSAADAPTAATKQRPQPAPASVTALQEDDLFGDDQEVGGAAGRQGGPLLETERDRLIRTGMLTPFDRLQGFERKVMTSKASAEPPGSTSSQAPWLNRRGITDLEGQVGRSGRPLKEVLKQTVNHAQAIRDGRPTTVLMDPAHLPRPDRDARQLPTIFWRQAASSKRGAAPAAAGGGEADEEGGVKKRRRQSTLPRQQRRRKQRSGAGSGRRRAGQGAGEEEGQEGDGAGEEEEDDGEGLGRVKQEEDEAAEAGPSGAGSGGAGARAQQQHGARRPKRQRGRRGAGTDSSGGGGGSSGSEYLPSGASSGEGDDDADLVPESDDDDHRGAGARRQRSGNGSGSRRRRRDGGSGGQASDSEVSGSVSDGSGGASEDEGGEYDDADAEYYEQRLERAVGSGFLWQAWGVGAAAGASGGGGSAAAADAQQEEQEGRQRDEEDVVFDGGFRVPGRVYSRLFPYQQTAVKWLWELYTQKAGGILGDEMGLGKTVQVIAFLAGLQYTGLYRPSLVVCPATVLRQWMREVRRWAPAFRVVMLHDSARSPGTDPRPNKSSLLKAATGSPAGLVLTTYEHLRLHRSLLLPVRWGLAVLDEGHKIRNPDSEVTLVAKQLQTMHRIIMTGSPIQNRLSELWSLFDFAFPGKLGTLPVFQAQFAIPIQIGGYTNASQLQVTTAYKCAVVLRDIIAPYLLRRRKADVNTQLPKKTEQVLFCSLTEEQQDLYRSYLASQEVSDILAGAKNALAGIDILRKVCNHPDLLERAKAEGAEDYGNPSRSGKLTVLQRLLSHWQRGGHKALVFCQTQQMLDIVEKLAKAEGYVYHRMDGSTAVAMRARLMDDFNNNPDVFVFLLTTKVGGLGVNLTGANRVLLYDPDWNPSNDMQARERAWRIGQRRDVAIYRLITSGTIEEKVYHRQIYKNFLTNKVLQDPRQKRFFTSRDIRDLFTLGEEYCGGPRTANGAGGDTNGQGGSGAGHHVTETARIFGSLGADLEVGASAAGWQTEAQAVPVPPHAPSAAAAAEEVEAGSDGGLVPGSSRQGEAEGFGEWRQDTAGGLGQGAHGAQPRSGDAGAGDAASREGGGADATPLEASNVRVVGAHQSGASLVASLARGGSAGAPGSAARTSVKQESGGEGLDLPDLGRWGRGVVAGADDAEADERQGEPSTSGREHGGGQAASGQTQRHGSGSKRGGGSRPGRGRGAQHIRPRSAASGEEPHDSAAGAAAAGDGDGGADESHILRDLFDGAGIRAALDHQRIEHANDPETLAMEREAARLAQRAAEELRRSRQACLDAPVNMPTWTGRSGAAGAPVQQQQQQQPAAGRARGAAGHAATSRAGTGSRAGGTGAELAAGAGPGGGSGGVVASPPAARPRRFGNVLSPTAQRPGGDMAPGAEAGAAGAGHASLGGSLAGAAVGSAALSSAALLARMRARSSQLSVVSQDASAAAQAAAAPTGPRLGGVGTDSGGADDAQPSGRSAAAGTSDVAANAAAAAAAAAGGEQGTAARLLQMLVPFLQAQGGEASSSNIVDHFSRRVPDAQMPLFRQLLKQVATLRRQPTGGVWILRSEFQG